MEMPNSNDAKIFPPLESDPDLFTLLLHNLGGSSHLHLQDVLSLEDIGSPALDSERALAFILISSFSDDQEESMKRFESERMASLSSEEKAAADKVIWVKQTIHNACGFYALLHAVCNISSVETRITPGSFLDTIVQAKSMEERKKILETSQSLDEAYIPIVLQGQTPVSEDWTVEPRFHYVCFVSAHGRVWDLNGGRNGPLDRGFGRDVVEVVKEYVRGQGDGAYSLLALVERAE